MLSEIFKRAVVGRLAAAKSQRTAKCAECGQDIRDDQQIFRCLSHASARVHAACFEEHLSGCGCYATALADCQGGGQHRK